MNGQRVSIPGSEIHHRTDARWSPAPPDEPVSVTVYLRRKADAGREQRLGEGLLSGRLQPMSREEMAETLGASTEDLQAVRAFAKQYGLPVTDENAAARTLHLDGTAQQMAAAFQTDLGMVEDTSGRHLSYKGPLTVPASLKDVVTAVLGLDKRPIAKRHDDHMQSPVNREDSPPQAASSNAGESTSTDQGTS